jgi:hypothetical protein
MRSDWFIVTCKVDNGCTVERYNTFVNALTASQAKFQVIKYWDSQYDTIVTIENCRHLQASEIFAMKIY